MKNCMKIDSQKRTHSLHATNEVVNEKRKSRDASRCRRRCKDSARNKIGAREFYSGVVVLCILGL
jgi:hypothetical protein